MAFLSPFPYSLISYAAALQEFGLIPSANPFAISRRAAPAEIFSLRRPIAISHFRCIVANARCSKFLSSPESSVRSFPRNFALLFPTLVLSLYPLRKMILPGLILTDNSSPCLLFLNSCPPTVTHLLFVAVERQLSRGIVSTEKIRENRFSSLSSNLVHTKILLWFDITKALRASFPNLLKHVRKI